MQDQIDRAMGGAHKKSAADQEKDRVRAERIAFALSGLSRVGSHNVNPDFSPPAPDKRQTRSANLRAGCTSTNLVYRYEPKEAREEYEIRPENHRQVTDLNKYTERALQLRDERKGAPPPNTATRHTVAPDAQPAPVARQYPLHRLVGLRVSHRSRLPPRARCARGLVHAVGAFCPHHEQEEVEEAAEDLLLRPASVRSPSFYFVSIASVREEARDGEK